MHLAQKLAFIGIFAAFGLAGAPRALAAPPTTQGSSLIVKVTPMSKIPPAGVEMMVGTNDSSHIAYLDHTGGKCQVFLDGVGQGEMEWVLPFSLTFSPDGHHLAYAVQSGNQVSVVVDGKSGPSYYELGADGRTSFSPDATRIAYFASYKDGGFRMVVDGKEQEPFEKSDYPIFSPDSKHLVYCGRSNGKTCVVLDGKPGVAYPAVTQLPVFSPDSQHLAYVAARNKKDFVVLDGVEQPEYDGVKVPRFSPDSKHLGYPVRVGAKSMIVLDGVPGKAYDGVIQGCPVFSPDSKHISYMAELDKEWHVVQDFTEGPPMEGGFGLPVFSPDSSQLAYLALRDKKAFAVIDGKEGPTFDGLSSVTFSPDGKHVAYGAKRGLKTCIVLDGQPQAEHDAVSPPVFSPDSNHLAYSARDNGRTFIVFDQQPTTERFDGTANDGIPFFDGPRSVHTLVFRNDQVFRIDVQLPETP
jgi:Tol biopolymer transport system component